MKSYHGHLFHNDDKWFGNWFADTDAGARSHSILAAGFGKHILSAAMLGWVAHTMSMGVPFIIAASRELALMVSKMALDYGYDVFTASQEEPGADLVRKEGTRPIAIIIFVGEFESDNRIGNRILSTLLETVLELDTSQQLAVFIEELPRFGTIPCFPQAVIRSRDTKLKFGITAHRKSDLYVAYPGTAIQIVESCWDLM